MDEGTLKTPIPKCCLLYLSFWDGLAIFIGEHHYEAKVNCIETEKRLLCRAIITMQKRFTLYNCNAIFSRINC
jgi:hypothetical protein